MRFKIVFVLNIFITSCFASFTKQDVTKTLNQLLEYHVEYKELDMELTARCIKLFLEQLDADKCYFLENEVSYFLNLEASQLKNVEDRVVKGDYSFFYDLLGSFQKAAERAKRLRSEVFREYTLCLQIPSQSVDESYLNFAENEYELKIRLQKKALRFLQTESKMGEIPRLNPPIKEKIFTLFEKKLGYFEKGILASKKEPVLALYLLKAFAKSLDAHTYVYSPEEAIELRALLEKQFEGVGIVLREGVFGVEIASIVPGSPAAKSQFIQKGDLVVSINDQRIAALSFDEVQKKMKGPLSSLLKLTLLAKGDSISKEVSLVREKILLSNARISCSYEPHAGGIIGKIILSSFYESSDGGSCEKDLKAAIKELRAQGDLLGLILDLRQNSGGFLTQAVKVAGLFMKSGIVVVSKYAKGKVNYLRDLDKSSYYNGPLLLLTSKASASAAEIVAQALQDYGTALIVGDTRTYGKGTIQYQNVTDKEAKTYFKVTVGKYYTVSGRTTQVEGVKADIEVPTAFHNLNIGEQYLNYALSADNIPSVYMDPLSDIEESRKSWFNQHYLPYLQLKEFRWRSVLETLSANSKERLSANPDYQHFLSRDKKTAPLSTNTQDLPLQEALNILKDMIYLQVSKDL